MAFRVVCGVGEVIETLDSQIVLSSVDFPEEGRPIMAMDAHFMNTILLVLQRSSKVVIKRDYWYF